MPNRNVDKDNTESIYQGTYQSHGSFKLYADWYTALVHGAS